ncbi:MAG: YdcF family protein [Actinomycetota bacterium]|nr:YdcF family protein [Actinomycetota bacterium]
MRIRRPRRVAVVAATVVLGVALGPAVVVRAATWGDRFADPGRTPARAVALVLGAGLLPDGTPSPYLRQRLDLATGLYRSRRVRAVLVTGDHGTSGHDEPGAMKAYLVAQGVPAARVVEDHAGFTTYDSCYRARAVFGVRDAVVVSQDYHLPRAVFTCRQLGIDAVGLGGAEFGQHPADAFRYLPRELLASAKALWQLLVSHPAPRFLGPRENGVDLALAELPHG